MQNDPERIAAGLTEGERDEHKRCFTYCGDDLCNCPARDSYGVLGFVFPALPVLKAMCSSAGLTSGAAKAAEMEAEVRKVLENRHEG